MTFCTSAGSKSVITDTHFSKRCRLGRSIVFVARLNEEHPGARYSEWASMKRAHCSIGADGIGRMAEGSAGSVWVIMPPRPLPPIDAGKPLTLDDIHIVRMDTNSTLDLHSAARRASCRRHDGLLERRRAGGQVDRVVPHAARRDPAERKLILPSQIFYAYILRAQSWQDSFLLAASDD